MQTTKVVLTNRHARFVRPYPEELNDVLKYRRPGWEYTDAGKVYVEWQSKVKKGQADPDEPRGWDGYLHLLHRDVVGAGVFLALRTTLERAATTSFSVQDNRRPPDFVPLTLDGQDKARAYQVECVKAMLKASGTGGLILNATGTGKTFIAGMYFRALKGSALFLVDELTLLDQAQKELSAVTGEPVGNIGNQQFNPKRITVATVQTIHRHRYDPKFVPWANRLQCVIIDEIHLMLNRSNFQTVTTIRPPVVFGLTATLEMKKRNVAYRAYDLCGPMVYDYPLERGVREGFLSKGLAISVQVDQSSYDEPIRGNPHWRWVRTRHRQRYHELYQSLIVDSRSRNHAITELVREAYKRGKYIVVLLERVKHLKYLSQALNSCRVPHSLVFGQVDVGDRVASKDAMEKGHLKVILTNKVFKKGINIKRIDLMIDAAAMKSRNDCIQKYGRGVRLCDGKKGLIYFDIADRGNRFEKAARARRFALRKVGIPVFKIDMAKGADQILDLAEKRLVSIK